MKVKHEQRKINEERKKKKFPQDFEFIKEKIIKKVKDREKTEATTNNYETAMNIDPKGVTVSNAFKAFENVSIPENGTIGLKTMTNPF